MKWVNIIIIATAIFMMLAGMGMAAYVDQDNSSGQRSWRLNVN